VISPSSIRGIFAAVLILPAVLACASKSASTGMAGHDHMAISHGMDAKITLPPGSLVKVADVQFMQGMIAHHAQAVFMTRLAESHGASPRVLFLARKIDQSQMPEIVLMQQWLAHYKQHVPDTSSYHNMMMPGMLTPKQIADLEKARAKEFDRQFLQLMIQHHEGALKMVKDLFATPGAAQEVDISVFANDVDVVQTAEIAQMRQMLADLQGS
jgi:uncharacterized protein (DUF305 family)